MSAQSKGKDFDFSFIVPIFNMEAYLEECIESVVAQSYGFDRIQLILVNDGSTDGSAEICKKYQEKYPENVLFIDQENAGVSAARNHGLERAEGRYINLLDSDDKWSLDACECVIKFLDENPGVRMVAARHELFGRTDADHPLAYKFKTDAVIDIRETCDYPQLSFSNVFIERELLIGKEFDTRLEVSEDFFLINSILLSVHKYGIMSDPSYYYRKRETHDSAIDISCSKKSYYLSTPRNCYMALFELSERLCGRVLPYIQYCVMYDLQWRIKRAYRTPLDQDELEEYKRLLLSLLRSIDDEIIVSQRNLNDQQKIGIIALKNGVPADQLRDNLRFVKSNVLLDESEFGGNLVFIKSMHKKTAINLLFAHPNKDSITFEGVVNTVFSDKAVRVRVKTETGTFDARVFPRVDSAHTNFFGDVFGASNGFEVTVPYAKTISFEVQVHGSAVPAFLKAGKFFPMPKHQMAYAVLGKYVMTWKQGMKGLSIAKRDSVWKKKREILYDACLIRENDGFLPLVRLRRKVLSANRNRKAIWLISDRIVLAGDNGEDLFTYLQEHPIDNVETYFVIGEDSPDYERMSKIGKVIPYGSKQHLLMHLLADRIISSAADEYVINPFGDKRNAVRDLEHFKYVFLQHGVTKDDLSGWIKRWNKNISLLVTASPREADSIIGNPRYGYDNSVVLQSGFPRHDKLLKSASTACTRLTIAPTWRQYLVGSFNTSDGTRERFEGFADSAYFKFYSALINDLRIKEALAQANWTMEFVLHPAMAQEADAFESDFCSVSMEYDYFEKFTKSAVWVTDYSSTAFDFALLKKPLVYIQNDAEEFFGKHGVYAKGYFDYERDGFGEVVYDYESAVSAIVDAIENPVMGDVYKQRVDEFFISPDKPRCQIVAEAIERL